MVTFTFKKDHRLALKADWSNYYQKSFAVALLNWEKNRQEEQHKPSKTGYYKK